MPKHNCGGTLRNSEVMLTRNIDGLDFTFAVPGQHCLACSEEIVSHDTAQEVEKLLGRWESTYERKNILFQTLNMPFISMASVGTLNSNTTLEGTPDTAEVAHVR